MCRPDGNGPTFCFSLAATARRYNGVDTCGKPCRQSQLQWLAKDLEAANANRNAVPWIVAMSHFPLYCSNCPKPGHGAPAWWNAEQCEFEGHDPSCNPPVRAASPNAANNNDMVPDFEPLFMKYGVDVYSSGHIHNYEFIYPTCVPLGYDKGLLVGVPNVRCRRS